MDATTMDPTGPAGLPTTETPAAEAAATPAPVVEALKDVGWFSLGLVALAVEGTGWLLKSATQKGKEVAPAVAKPLKSAGSSVEEALGEMGAGLKGVGRAVGKRAEAVEQVVDERVAAAIERVGGPILAEMGDLKAKVEELTKKIENLQSKREKPSH